MESEMGTFCFFVVCLATLTLTDQGGALAKEQMRTGISDVKARARIPRAMSMKAFDTFVVDVSWHSLFSFQEPLQFDNRNVKATFTQLGNGEIGMRFEPRRIMPAGDFCLVDIFVSAPKSRQRVIFESVLLTPDGETVELPGWEVRFFSKRPSHYVWFWICIPDKEALSGKVLTTGSVCTGSVILELFVKEFPLREFPLECAEKELAQTGLRFEDPRFRFRTGQPCPEGSSL